MLIILNLFTELNAQAVQITELFVSVNYTDVVTVTASFSKGYKSTRSYYIQSSKWIPLPTGFVQCLLVVSQRALYVPRKEVRLSQFHQNRVSTQHSRYGSRTLELHLPYDLSLLYHSCFVTQHPPPTLQYLNVLSKTEK